MNEKNKCLDCVRKAGTNSVVVNPDNLFARVSEITDTDIKAITFDGETITLDDTFEVAMYMAPDESSEPDNAATPVMNKACGCQLNKVKATPPDAFVTSLTDAIDQMSKALTAQISELAMSFEKNKSIVQPAALGADEIRAVVIDAMNVITAETYKQNHTAQPVTSWKNIHPNM